MRCCFDAIQEMTGPFRLRRQGDANGSALDDDLIRDFTGFFTLRVQNDAERVRHDINAVLENRRIP